MYTCVRVYVFRSICMHIFTYICMYGIYVYIYILNFNIYSQSQVDKGPDNKR